MCVFVAGIANGIDFPVIASMMVAEGSSEHFEAFAAIEKAASDRAGKNVAEQFWVRREHA